MRRPALSRAALVAVLLAACSSGSVAPGGSHGACPEAPPIAEQAAEILATARTARVTTSLGAFTITLDPQTAPIAVANLVTLARCGFYDDLTFHRVIAGFVIQAGDPQTRTNPGPFEGLGSGGPGYQFEVELPPPSQSYARYTVAMANSMQYDFATGEIQSGTDTNRSQFFIDLVDLTGVLRPYYSILGTVTDGTTVVDAIGEVAVNNPGDGVPLTPVVIESIVIAP